MTDRVFKHKAEAVLDAIRNAEVGSTIAIHNEMDNSVWCVIKVVVKEHDEI